MRLSLVFALLSTVSLSTVACAGDADEAVFDDGSAATAAAAEASSTTPITLENWVAHPRVRAVRAIVTAIDAAGFPTESKFGCHVSKTKRTDPQKRIRQLVISTGEGGFASTTTGYYDEQGRLRFVFVQESDETAARPFAAEHRAYFDEKGNKFWEVRREGTLGSQGEPNFAGAVDVVPKPADQVNPSAAKATPASLWEGNGCA